MHDKITMLVEEVDETISESFSAEITSDTTESYEETYSDDVTVYCTQQGDKLGVGLWQWVTMSADGKSKTRTRHTVCRYGDNYDSSPKCPWNACIDGECTTCDPAWKQ